MKNINMVMTDDAYETVKKACLKLSSECGETLTVTEYARYIVLEESDKILGRK